MAGLGDIGALHARNLSHLVPGARLVRLVDQAEVLGKRFGEELAVPCSPSYAEALADPEVDAVVIATPTPLHAEMVIAAAARGRHVFCEKPLALDLESGRRAARRTEAAGVCLQVGFQRRFDAGWAAAKQRVDAGDLGEVQLFRVSHRNRGHPHGGRTDRLGSLFVDMSVHDLDSARWLIGEVRALSAFASPSWAALARGTDVQTAVIVLRFESDALGIIDNTRAAGYGFDCAAEVMGETSTLRVGTSLRSPDLEWLTAQGLRVELPVDHIESHRAAYLEEMRHFIRSVRSGRASGVGGGDALAALALALAAEQSFAEHRPVELSGCA